MPSLAKLKNTRKRHFYFKRRVEQEEAFAMHARHRANGRTASLGLATCGACARQECWVSGPWLNIDVACTCGGSVGVELRGLCRADAAWRDRKGIVHIVEIDQLGSTITACRQPLEHKQRTLHSFVGNMMPSCLWCAGVAIWA